MIAKLKTALITALLLVGAAATMMMPVQAQAAPNNGAGIVYHPSDCGRWNIRYYGSGGADGGSACGYWVRGELLGVLWNRGDRNHNYTHNELESLLEQVRGEERAAEWCRSGSVTVAGRC